MSLTTIIYLAGITPNVKLFFLLVAIFSVFALLSLLIYSFMGLFSKKSEVVFPLSDREENIKFNNTTLQKRLKTKNVAIRVSVKSLVLSVIILIFLPSEKTIYLMLGAHTIEQVVKSERVNKISNDLLTIIEGKIKETNEN